MAPINTLVRCQHDPSHDEPEECEAYRACDTFEHVPNEAGTACVNCGLHAERVDPAALAGLIIDELSRYRLARILAQETLVLSDGQVVVPIHAFVDGLIAERDEVAHMGDAMADLAKGDHFAYPAPPPVDPGSARWVASQPGYLPPITHSGCFHDGVEDASNCKEAIKLD